jgi:hypothetical protein
MTDNMPPPEAMTSARRAMALTRHYRRGDADGYTAVLGEVATPYEASLLIGSLCQLTNIIITRCMGALGDEMLAELTITFAGHEARSEDDEQ